MSFQVQVIDKTVKLLPGPALTAVKVAVQGPAAPPVPDGVKGDISVTGGVWKAVRDVYLHTVQTNGSDQRSLINSLLAAIDTSGGPVRAILPKGDITINDTLQVPNRIHLDATSPGATRLLRKNTFAAGVPMVENLTDSTTQYVADGIRIANIAFVNQWLNMPAWLSTGAGVAVADPEADYLPGGCLAPAVPATVTVTVDASGAVVSATIVSGGSGYTNNPVAWVEDAGGGYGCQLKLTASGGSVTGATVKSGGFGYSSGSPPTVTVAGGGANPATALYAANRRNPNHDTGGGAAIRLRSTIDAVIEGCSFTDFQKWAVNDEGNWRLTVRNNSFTRCGKSDITAACHRSTSYGQLRGGHNHFTHNTVTDARRLVCLIDTQHFIADFNHIEGWYESCFYVANKNDPSGIGADGQHTVIENNFARGGRRGDLVCTFVEGNGDTIIRHNHVEDVHGEFVSMSGGPVGKKESGWFVGFNTFVAATAREKRKPFGPFGERVTYQVDSGEEDDASWPTAGEQVEWGDTAVLKYKTQTTAASGAPVSAVIIGNRVSTRGGGYFSYLLGHQRGAANAQKNLQLVHNVGTDAPGCELYKADALASAFDPNSTFLVDGNVGFIRAASRHWRRVVAAEAKVNDTSVQNVFAAPSAFQARPKTLCRFTGLIRFASGTAAHDLLIGFALGGGATVAAITWLGEARPGTPNTLSTSNYNSNVWATADLQTIMAASNNGQKWVRIAGVVEFDQGGTITPQFQFSVAPGGPVQVLPGSVFELAEIAPAGASFGGGVT